MYVYDELDKEQDNYFNTEEIRKLAISKVDDKILKLYLDTIQLILTIWFYDEQRMKNLNKL